MNDDFNICDEDEKELLYEIERLQKKLDRLENSREIPRSEPRTNPRDRSDSRERSLLDEIDRLNGELDAARCEPERRGRGLPDIEETIGRIDRKLASLPALDDLNKLIEKLSKSADAFEQSGGESVATELAYLRNAVTSCPVMVQPAPKKDELFLLKQFFELKRLLGGFDEQYDSYVTDTLRQADELYKVKTLLGSSSTSFLEKLFGILNFYNTLLSGDSCKEIVDSFNLIVSDFFNQPLSADKLDKLLYLEEVSTVYKVSDVLKAKAKRMYTLYDEALTAKASKQPELIRQLYELKCDIAGNDEATERVYRRLKEDGRPSAADVRRLLGEMLYMPIRVIVPPPVYVSDAKSAGISPERTLGERLDVIFDRLRAGSVIPQPVSADNDGRLDAVERDLREIKELLKRPVLKTVVADTGELQPTRDEMNMILGEIVSLREELAHCSELLDRTEAEPETVPMEVTAPPAAEKQAGDEVLEEDRIGDDIASIKGIIEDLREELLSPKTSENDASAIEIIGDADADRERLYGEIGALREELGRLAAFGGAAVVAGPEKPEIFDFDDVVDRLIRASEIRFADISETFKNAFDEMAVRADADYEKLCSLLGETSAKEISFEPLLKEFDVIKASLAVGSTLRNDEMPALISAVGDIRAKIDAATAPEYEPDISVENEPDPAEEIALLGRQLEGLKSKIDDLHRALNKINKTAAMARQVESIKLKVDKLQKASVRLEKIPQMARQIESLQKSSVKAALSDKELGRGLEKLNTKLNAAKVTVKSKPRAKKDSAGTAAAMIEREPDVEIADGNDGGERLSSAGE